MARPATRPGALTRRQLCLGAAAAMLAAPWAAAADDSAAPAEVAGHLAASRLRGSATMRFFGLRIYELRLWATADFAPAQFAAHAFALELRYARTLQGADIVSRSLAEMARIGPFNAQQGQAWREAMAQAFPDVVAGDRLTGLHRPQAPTRFFHNGQATQAIADADFARLFFGIWLSPQTSEPALRKRLLSLPA